MEEKKKSFSEITEGILAIQRIEATPAGKERRTKINFYKQEIANKLSEFNNDSRRVYFLEQEKNRLEEEHLHSRIQWKSDNATLSKMKLQEVINRYLKFYMDRVGEDNYVAMKKIIEEGVITKNDTSAAISHEEVLSTDKTEVAENHEPEEITEPLPEGFAQITYSTQISKEKLRGDFMLLSTEKNPLNNKPFMEEKVIDELLDKNFAIFGLEKPNGKYFPINLLETQKYILRTFMYYIFYKYEIIHKKNKQKYARFLVHNFELFKTETPEILATNIRNIDMVNFVKLRPRNKNI